MEDIRIFPTSPYGCAMDVSSLWVEYRIIYGRQGYIHFEEGLDIRASLMVDYNNFIIAHQEFYSSNVFLSIFKGTELYDIIWFNGYKTIDEYINPGRIIINQYAPHNLIAISLSNTSEIIMYDSTLTDINDFTESNDITISPNPPSDFIEISVGAQRAVPDVVSIFDNLGTEVLNNSQFSIVNSQLKIDVSHLSPGVYFVRVGDVVRKFIKI